MLRPRYSIPTIWILNSSLPQAAFHSYLLSTRSKSYERELSVGETIIWSTRARSSSSTHHLLLLGEWCLLDWLGVTWEPPTRLWSWTKEFVREGDRLLCEDLPLLRQVLRGRRPWWDRQGCFMGGALRGLAQLLPFVGWSLHQRGCTIAPPIGTTPKASVSPIAFESSKPFPLLFGKLHALISAAYTLFACLLELCDDCLTCPKIAKICQTIKLRKG